MPAQTPDPRRTLLETIAHLRAQDRSHLPTDRQIGWDEALDALAAALPVPQEDEPWQFVNALLDDQPINGQYVHHLFCNAGRDKPVGNDMCSCPIGRRIKAAKRAALPVETRTPPDVLGLAVKVDEYAHASERSAYAPNITSDRTNHLLARAAVLRDVAAALRTHPAAPVPTGARTPPTQFRAGDTVKHGPTGETWLLACDQEREDVLPAGWPETLAKASDCTLVEAATDEQRLGTLQSTQGCEGYRGSVARRQLAAALPASQGTAPATVPENNEWLFVHEVGEWRCHCGYRATSWDRFVAHFSAPPLPAAPADPALVALIDRLEAWSDFDSTTMGIDELRIHATRSIEVMRHAIAALSRPSPPLEICVGCGHATHAPNRCIVNGFDCHCGVSLSSPPSAPGPWTRERQDLMDMLRNVLRDPSASREAYALLDRLNTENFYKPPQPFRHEEVKAACEWLKGKLGPIGNTKRVYSMLDHFAATLPSGGPETPRPEKKSGPLGDMTGEDHPWRK
jgi:hypothetical protein